MPEDQSIDHPYLCPSPSRGKNSEEPVAFLISCALGQSQPQFSKELAKNLARLSRNRIISRKACPERRRRDAKACCHFDHREKSFSDPSHSLGMTALVCHFCVSGVFARANFPTAILEISATCANFSQGLVALKTQLPLALSSLSALPRAGGDIKGGS